MQLELSTEDREFREELRTFFTTEVPEAIRDAVREGRELSKDQLVESQQTLNAGGLAVPHWPEEWGGRGWSELRRDHILQVPVPVVTFATFGSGDERWGQRKPVELFGAELGGHPADRDRQRVALCCHRRQGLAVQLDDANVHNQSLWLEVKGANVLEGALGNLPENAHAGSPLVVDEQLEAVRPEGFGKVVDRKPPHVVAADRDDPCPRLACRGDAIDKTCYRRSWAQALRPEARDLDAIQTHDDRLEAGRSCGRAAGGSGA